jgi:hypothetical protein
MNPTLRCAFVVVLLLSCRTTPDKAGLARHAPSHPSASSDPAAVIDYRGEPIRLTKRYEDYDDYKNDPNNIAPDENARVQALVKGAPVPERCADRREIVMAAGALKVPGYGMMSFGTRNAEGGREIVAEAIEIPHAGADRYLVYMSDGSGYHLADDVVLPEQAFVRDVDIRDGTIIYRNGDGRVVATRPVRPAP